MQMNNDQYRKGDHAKLLIAIPRLGLKPGDEVHVDEVKGGNFLEVGYWDSEKLERVEVIVEWDWVEKVPFSPRGAIRRA